MRLRLCLMKTSYPLNQMEHLFLVVIGALTRFIGKHLNTYNLA